MTDQTLREPLDIRDELIDGRAQVTVRGEFDLEAVNFFRRRLEYVEAQRPSLIVLDLRGLRFMDSSGMRELIGLHRRARASAARLVIVKPPGRLADLLAMTRLDHHLETVADPRAASLDD